MACIGKGDAYKPANAPAQDQSDDQHDRRGELGQERAARYRKGSTVPGPALNVLNRADIDQSLVGADAAYPVSVDPRRKT